MRPLGAGLVGVVAAAVLAGCAGGRGASEVAAARFAERAVPLLPVPTRVDEACGRVQLRSPLPILCPTRLPRSTKRLRVRVIPIRSLDERGPRTPIAGVSFEYGAPAGRRDPLWKNAPCCALHFVVLWVPDRPSFVPVGAKPGNLAGMRGLIRDAAGVSGARCSVWPQCFYWANHSWFTWRRGRIRYVASLHYFGRRATRSTLARLIAGLRPEARVRGTETRGAVYEKGSRLSDSE